MQEIKILVVDHRAIIRTGIAAILGTSSDIEVVGQAECGEKALTLVKLHSPNVVLIDIDLRGRLNGMEVIRALQRSSPPARVLVLTNLLEPSLIREALQEGVKGYLLKDTSLSELVHAIRAACQGIPTLSAQVTQMLIQDVAAPARDGRDLTPREAEVLKLIARGWNNQEIARELSISLSTVQFHVSNILAKLGVHNRIEAATFAVRRDLAGSARTWASGRDQA